LTCVCSGFEVPPCPLTTHDPNRRIGLCTLAFGTDSTSAGAAEPAGPTASSSHPSNVAAAAAAAAAAPGAIHSISAVSPSSQPSQPLIESSEEAVSESTSVPPAVCPGYQSEADENQSVDFPPAYLPDGTDEFRIVVTHVDDDCHIYGHALREGTALICVPWTFYVYCFNH